MFQNGGIHPVLFSAENGVCLSVDRATPAIIFLRPDRVDNFSGRHISLVKSGDFSGKSFLKRRRLPPIPLWPEGIPAGPNNRSHRRRI
jgi:hypothetical protein